MEQIRSRSVVAGHVGIAGRVGFGGSSVGVGDGAVFVAIAWSNPGGGVGVGVVSQFSAALGVKPVEDVDDSPTAAIKRASAATSPVVERSALSHVGAPWLGFVMHDNLRRGASTLPCGGIYRAKYAKDTYVH
jgi:outer membrane lipoprotein SlyB